MGPQGPGPSRGGGRGRRKPVRVDAALTVTFARCRSGLCGSPGCGASGRPRPDRSRPRPSCPEQGCARALKADRDSDVLLTPKREAGSLQRRGAGWVGSAHCGGPAFPVSHPPPLARPDPPRAAPWGTPPDHTANLGPERAARSYTHACLLPRLSSPAGAR